MTPELDRGETACGHDAAAYVLGALDPGEVEEFRRHLKGCIVCRDEVAALGTVVESLPMAAPQLAVNRSLRRRVMADVRAARRETARERVHGAAFSSRRGGFRPVMAAAAAVLAAVAAVVAGVQLSSEGSSRTRVVRATVTPLSASAVVQVEAGRAQLIVRRMPASPAGEIYEVWLKRGARPPVPTSALFGVTSDGSAAVDVPGDLDGVSEVLVTPERLGGSRRPTHAPVIIARLA
jgi:anti-sigma-K factor RskA